MNISVKDAKKLLFELTGIQISIPSLIKMAKANNLGHQLTGKHGIWYINEEKFKKHIDEFIKK